MLELGAATAVHEGQDFQILELELECEHSNV